MIILEVIGGTEWKCDTVRHHILAKTLENVLNFVLKGHSPNSRVLLLYGPWRHESNIVKKKIGAAPRTQWHWESKSLTTLGVLFGFFLSKLCRLYGVALP